MNNTNGAIPDTQPDRLVSWQSAFWAVFTLALNTYLQDPGTLASMPPAYRAILPASTLRLSPFVCLFDAFSIISSLVGCFWHARSLPTALTLVLESRSLEANESGRSSVLGESRARKVVALFLAITQLVKLTGMQGVPFITFCGWNYFIAYALLELVRLGASWDRSRGFATGGYLSPEWLSRIHKGGCYIALALHIGLTFKLAKESQTAYSNDYYMVAMALNLSLTLLLPAATLLLSIKYRYTAYRTGHFLWAGLWVLWKVQGTIYVNIAKGPEPDWIRYLDYIFAVLLSGGCVNTMVTIAKIPWHEEQNGLSRTGRVLRVWVHVVMGYVFFALVIVYFVGKYESAATYKPEWTDLLG